MKNNKIKIVDYPEMELTKETATKYLSDFYTKLGWNGTDSLDPFEIKINQKQWLEICSSFNELRGEFSYNISYQWMNQGPAATEKIPYGKVEIGHKAFTEWVEK